MPPRLPHPRPSRRGQCQGPGILRTSSCAPDFLLSCAVQRPDPSLRRSRSGGVRPGLQDSRGIRYPFGASLEGSSAPAQVA